MSRIKQEFKLTNWALVFFIKSTIQVNIVKVLSTGSEELHTVCHGEFVRVRAQIECFLSRKVWEEE